MRLWRKLALGFAAGLLVGGVFVLGYLVGGGSSAAAEANDFGLLRTVSDLLERSFLGDIPPTTKQVYGAVHGLVASYDDPYTVFVEPAPREMERDELRGHFGGIGAYMGRNENGDIVMTVMRDRPAARGGIQDGDILLEVDGRPITPEMKVEEVVALVRGDVGSQVTLKVLRPGAGDPFTVTLVRERIETPSVESRVLDPERGTGYVRVSLFSERTASELQSAIQELAGQDVTKLVLDLRGNGGGLVDAAVDTASQFLAEGEVLRELRRSGKERFYPVKPGDSPAQAWELALLIDGGTASASEIVAGALHDQGRAVLIGEKTFGKGSVQEVHSLPDGSSLHVTVARWLTPNRHQIDRTGIEPDIAVAITQEDREAGRDPQLARAQSWLAGER